MASGATASTSGPERTLWDLKGHPGAENRSLLELEMAMRALGKHPWDLNGHHLESAPLEPESAPLGLEWAPLGPEWEPLGLEWAPLGLEWVLLGPEWAPLGLEWAPLGPEWEPLGT